MLYFQTAKFGDYHTILGAYNRSGHWTLIVSLDMHHTVFQNPVIK